MMQIESLNKGQGRHHSGRDGGLSAQLHCVTVNSEAIRRYTAALVRGVRCMVEQSELNRLFWHSRRGMLELDVLLVPFVQEVYPTLDEENQARYRKLLECEDQDMFGWFMQRGEPEDADLRHIVRMILDRVQPK